MHHFENLIPEASLQKNLGDAIWLIQDAINEMDKLEEFGDVHGEIQRVLDAALAKLKFAEKQI